MPKPAKMRTYAIIDKGILSHVCSILTACIWYEVHITIYRYVFLLFDRQPFTRISYLTNTIYPTFKIVYIHNWVHCFDIPPRHKVLANKVTIFFNDLLQQFKTKKIFHCCLRTQYVLKDSRRRHFGAVGGTHRNPKQVIFSQLCG